MHNSFCVESGMDSSFIIYTSNNIFTTSFFGLRPRIVHCGLFLAQNFVYLKSYDDEIWYIGTLSDLEYDCLARSALNKARSIVIV